MNIAYLREFVVISEMGNLTRAAVRLNSSQPSLSRHMRMLEDELGIVLLTRGGGVTLSAAGRAFLPHALDVLKAHDATVAWARDYAHSLPARLAVESFIGFKKTDDLVGAVRTGLSGLHANLVFEWGDIKDGDPVDDLARGGCDLALLCLTEDSIPEGFESMPLFSEPLVAVVGRNNPLSAYSEIGLDALSREVWWENVSVSRRFAAVCRSALAAAGQEPVARPLPWTDAAGYYEQVASLDTGYVLDFASVAAGSFNQVLCHAIRLTQPLSATMYAVWRADNGNPALREAVELMGEAIQPQGASGRYSQSSSAAALAPATRPK